MRPIFLLFCWWAGMCALSGQEFYFNRYEVADGLSHNTIHCVTQDDLGFMWFGTKNGVNRFDGYRFKWYQYDEESPTSLGSNFIECIEFAQRKLWVGTDNGLYRGDPATGAFELVKGTDGQPIVEVKKAREGELWFIAADTLCLLDPATMVVKRFGAQQLAGVANITLSPAGALCVATADQLFRYDGGGGIFVELPLDLDLSNNFPLSISRIHFLNESSLAIGTVSHGAFLYDLPNKRSVPILNKQENRLYVRDFLLRGNDLWIGTESGVYVFNLFSRQTEHLEKSALQPYALSDNAVYALFDDADGGLWVGTYFRGLNYYHESLTGFHKYMLASQANSGGGTAIREMTRDAGGKLWIGTEDAGLDRYDPATGGFTHFELRTAEDRLLATNIHGLVARGDELWVGTFQNGLFILDAASGRIKKHLVAGEESGLRSNFIYTFYVTRDSTLFALTSSGVHRYSEAAGKFVAERIFPETYFYTSMLEDRDGGLWAGTYWDGLFHAPATNEGTPVMPARAVARDLRLSNDAINGLFEDSGGRIWVATENGLNRIDRATDSVTRYGKADGFPSNVFYAILEDSRGRLWVSTANGLVCFSPGEGTLVRYTTDSGLLSNQFSYNSALLDGDGRMFFGGVLGFVSFDPFDPRLAQMSATDKLVLTDFGLGFANTEDGIVDVSDGAVELRHDQSTFTVSFSALQFAMPGLTEYSYALDGLDGGWTAIGNSPVIHFTDLRPGDYRLRLRSRTQGGSWSEAKALLAIHISPPFWRSGAALLFYALVGGLLVFASLRFYHRYNREKTRQGMRLLHHEKEREVYKAKIEFFTNISHEILTPLTLIKNPIEKVLADGGTAEKVRNNLSLVHRNTLRLIALVQQLLDFRSTEMEHVKLSFVRADVALLLREIFERFRGEAADRGIQVCLNVGQEATFADIDAEAFRKMAGNLIQNAIKYGDRRMAITLDTTETDIAVRVKSDGLLIPPAEQDRIFKPFYRLPDHEGRPGTGIGLSLSHSLAELHGGSLSLERTEDEFNTFLLLLPLVQDSMFDLPAVTDGLVATAAVPAALPPGPASSETRPTILVAEDNPDLLGFIAKDLREDYTVLTATNGAEALAILGSQSVQLIVSDVMMPGTDGLELCRRVKTDVGLSHIPLILLTARTALTAEIMGLESGADAYVTKPFALSYLRTRISNLLGNRLRVVEHFSSSPLAILQSVAHSPTDERFLAELDTLIRQNMADTNLSVEHLARYLHMSRSTLYRKIKDLSGSSPNELINLVRLKKAAELLRDKSYKIYEVAELVGYSSARSFGRNFLKQFGMTPSDYLEREKSL